LHTTVSVTKGIGSALLGGRGGVALLVGGNGESVVMARTLERKTLRRDCDRAIRSADRDIDSIGICVCIFESSYFHRRQLR
jgi:hypothetical protein